MSNVDLVLDSLDHFTVSTSTICSPDHVMSHFTSKQLKILSQNIRSINRNFPTFETLLERIGSSACDILVLSECWLQCLSNAQLPILDSYSVCFTTKHLNQSDGVAVYIKSDLTNVTIELDLHGTASGLLIKLGSDTAILSVQIAFHS